MEERWDCSRGEVHQNCLEGSLQHKLLGPPVTVSDSVHLGYENFLPFFPIFKRLAEVELICKVMIMSAAQQSDSAAHVPTSILFRGLFLYR